MSEFYIYDPRACVVLTSSLLGICLHRSAFYDAVFICKNAADRGLIFAVPSARRGNGGRRWYWQFGAIRTDADPGISEGADASESWGNNLDERVCILRRFIRSDIGRKALCKGVPPERTNLS